MSRTAQGMLQMLAVFLFLLACIGLPTNIKDATGYAAMMSLSSVVAVKIATRDGSAFVGSAGIGLFLIQAIGIILVFVLNCAGGYSTGNYAIATVTGSIVIALTTVFVSACLEPSEETLRERRENAEFENKTKLEIENTVRNFMIKYYPKVDAGWKFGISEHFPLETFYLAWCSLQSVARRLELGAEGFPIRMDVSVDPIGPSLLVTIDHGEETRKWLSTASITLEIRSVLSRWQPSEADCKNFARWISAAIAAKPELGDLTRRPEDFLSLWG